MEDHQPWQLLGQIGALTMYGSYVGGLLPSGWPGCCAAHDTKADASTPNDETRRSWACMPRLATARNSSSLDALWRLAGLPVSSAGGAEGVGGEVAEGGGDSPVSMAPGTPVVDGRPPR